MKRALVLEGGAMKGMYTAGVLDRFMENGEKFDAMIGVSAGALFGINYLSDQKGRVIRYNKKYNSDRDYMGLLPLIRTGNIVDTDYAYRKVPYELDPFDDKTYKESGVPFYAVVTNVETGQPEYIRIDSVFEQMDVLRASGSMPFVSRPVKIGNNYYLDGAITDSIPYKKMLELGYEELVVVLTKEDGYVKKPISPVLSEIFYKRKYPKLDYCIKHRHKMYNAQMSGLEKMAEDGKLDIIRPHEAFGISRTEKDPEKLEAVYQNGYHDADVYLKKKMK